MEGYEGVAVVSDRGDTFQTLTTVIGEPVIKNNCAKIVSKRIMNLYYTPLCESIVPIFTLILTFSIVRQYH